METLREVLSELMKKNPVTPSCWPSVPIPSCSHTQGKMGMITPSQTLHHLYPPIFPLLSVFPLNAGLLSWPFQLLKDTHQTYIPARWQSIWDQGVIHTIWVLLSQIGNFCLAYLTLIWHRELWMGCNFYNMILRSWLLDMSSGACFQTRASWIAATKSFLFFCHIYSTPQRSTYLLHLTPFHAVRIQAFFRYLQLLASCMNSETSVCLKLFLSS